MSNKKIYFAYIVNLYNNISNLKFYRIIVLVDFINNIIEINIFAMRFNL